MKLFTCSGDGIDIIDEDPTSNIFNGVSIVPATQYKDRFPYPVCCLEGALKKMGEAFDVAIGTTPDGTRYAIPVPTGQIHRLQATIL